MKPGLLYCSALVAALSLFFSAGAGGKAVAAEESILLLEPYTVEQGAADAARNQPSAAAPAYVARTGEVILHVAGLFSGDRQASPSAGRGSDGLTDGYVGTRMRISFFENVGFGVQVVGESRSADGAVTLRGRQDGAPFSTFSMVLAGGSYIISCEDIATGMRYRAVGDAGTGVGTVREIDPADIPPAYGGEPVAPAP